MNITTGQTDSSQMAQGLRISPQAKQIPARRKQEWSARRRSLTVTLEKFQPLKPLSKVKGFTVSKLLLFRSTKHNRMNCKGFACQGLLFKHSFTKTTVTGVRTDLYNNKHILAIRQFHNFAEQGQISLGLYFFIQFIRTVCTRDTITIVSIFTSFLNWVPFHLKSKRFEAIVTVPKIDQASGFQAF